MQGWANQHEEYSNVKNSYGEKEEGEFATVYI